MVHINIPRVGRPLVAVVFITAAKEEVRDGRLGLNKQKLSPIS